jgi:hypothetical protein
MVPTPGDGTIKSGSTRSATIKMRVMRLLPVPERASGVSGASPFRGEPIRLVSATVTPSLILKRQHGLIHTRT